MWQTAMGETGRLQSNAVQRKLPSARDLEVHLVSAPSEVCRASSDEAYDIWPMAYHNPVILPYSVLT